MEILSWSENNQLLLLIILGLWTLPWKGMALWRAARRKEKGWFIALLVLNTLAVLEIIYLFVFSNRKKKEEKPE
jgi:4-amino-4-deoxy-L-arabinose transferase-like glycosyltransferase